MFLREVIIPGKFVQTIVIKFTKYEFIMKMKNFIWNVLMLMKTLNIMKKQTDLIIVDY